MQNLTCLAFEMPAGNPIKIHLWKKTAWDDCWLVVDYDYHAYKDYAGGGGPGYDYYAGYDQHDDYGIYGPTLYAEPAAMGRGRGPRAVPPRMHRGNALLLCSVSYSGRGWDSPPTPLLLSFGLLKICCRNTKSGAENLAFWGNLGPKLKLFVATNVHPLSPPLEICIGLSENCNFLSPLYFLNSRCRCCPWNDLLDIVSSVELLSTFHQRLRIYLFMKFFFRLFTRLDSILTVCGSSSLCYLGWFKDRLIDWLIDCVCDSVSRWLLGYVRSDVATVMARWWWWRWPAVGRWYRPSLAGHGQCAAWYALANQLVRQGRRSGGQSLLEHGQRAVALSLEVCMGVGNPMGIGFPWEWE